MAESGGRSKAPGGGSDDVLDHCYSLGPHVRGCWVVDLVLGKE
ncbi:hypothetical protein [Gemmata palustris]|nr:hypothetical protein [Gemmata palustris]